MIEYVWISNLLCDVAFTWRPGELSFQKVTSFGDFCDLNSSWIRESINLMFMSSSRNKFRLLYQNSVIDVFVGFRPPCGCPSRWAPAWRLHTNLFKFGLNISLDISYAKYSSADLNLGEKLGIFTSFHFPDSGRTLSIEWFWFFSSILNGVTLKTSNISTVS